MMTVILLLTAQPASKAVTLSAHFGIVSFQYAPRGHSHKHPTHKKCASTLIYYYHTIIFIRCQQHLCWKPKKCCTKCFLYTPKEKAHPPKRKKTAAGLNRPKTGLCTFFRAKTVSLGSIGKTDFPSGQLNWNEKKIQTLFLIRCLQKQTIPVS